MNDFGDGVVSVLAALDATNETTMTSGSEKGIAVSIVLVWLSPEGFSVCNRSSLTSVPASLLDSNGVTE